MQVIKCTLNDFITEKDGTFHISLGILHVEGEIGMIWDKDATSNLVEKLGVINNNQLSGKNPFLMQIEKMRISIVFE